MATVDAKTIETVETVVDLINVNASVVQIGNAVRDAAGGDPIGPTITALSTLETFASLAKLSIKGAGGVLAVSALIKNRDRYIFRHCCPLVLMVEYATSIPFRSSQLPAPRHSAGA